MVSQVVILKERSETAKVVTDAVADEIGDEVVDEVLGKNLGGSDPLYINRAIAQVGIVVSGVESISNDSYKQLNYKYQYHLNATDDDFVQIFFSNTLFQYGDCVYVDKGFKKGVGRYL